MSCQQLNDGGGDIESGYPFSCLFAAKSSADNYNGLPKRFIRFNEIRLNSDHYRS